MKKISLLISALLVVSTIGFSQNIAKNNSKAEMAFTSEMHDYGTLEYDGDGSHTFTFRNSSNKPLIITNVKSSCGCTVPTWSKEPVQPGATGSISVKYNTKLSGAFNKTIQVFSSAKNSPIRLTVKGRVTPHPAQTKTKAGEQVIGSGAATAESKVQTSAEKKALTEMEHEQSGLSKEKQARKVDQQKRIEEARKKIKK